MNVRLEDNEKKNKSLKIFYVSIVVIWIIDILNAVVINITRTLNNEWKDLKTNKLNDSRVSDARDYELQRMKVVAYSKNINNQKIDIVQTYNYDLTNKKECTFEDMLNLKKISRQQANSTILSEIKKVEKQVNERAELGYSVYKRNSSDSMYNVDNITEFFLGEDDVLYVIFAYGNQNQTNEMDIVVM